MKKKILHTLLAAATLFLLLPGVTALAEPEDFTTFTEVDPDSVFTVSSDTIITTAAEIQHGGYVYKDFGVNYFDNDFVFFITVNMTSMTNGYPFVIMGMGDDLQCYRAYDTGGTGFFVTGQWHDTDQWQLLTVDLDGGVNHSGDYIYDLDCGANYYLKIYVSGGEGVCNVYSDESRQTLVGSTSSTLNGEAYRYLFGAMGYDYDSLSGYPNTGRVSDLDTNPIEYPTCETFENPNVYYDDFYEHWIAVLSGNITSTGGGSCSSGYYIKLATDSEYSTWCATIGDNETDPLYYTEAHALTHGETYDYYFYVCNEAGSANGTVKQFTVEAGAAVPTVTTLSYPMVKDTDNLTCRVYGYINDWGSSNCTGFFYWKETGSANWTQSANTTDLVTGNQFNALLSGLELLQEYDYMAVAVNDEGMGYGSIGQFVLLEIEAPEITTLPADNILANYARFWAYLDYSGDSSNTSSAGVYFQYRPAGTSTWASTSSLFYYTGATVNRTIGGLLPSTNYEYRAVAWSMSANWTTYTDYGETRSFMTYSDSSAPTVYTGNATYISVGTVRLYGELLYDGGTWCILWFQYRANDEAEWTETAEQYGDDDGYFYSNAEYNALVSGLETDTYYYYRAAGKNTKGTSYGSTRSFLIQSTSVTPDEEEGDNPPEETGNWFTDWLNNLEYSWGLNNTLGHWAFMFILMIVVSVIFGALAIFARESWLRKIYIGLAIGLDVIIFGGFLFSGRLGLWAVAVLIFVAVGLIIIFGGSLLNRGRS